MARRGHLKEVFHHMRLPMSSNIESVLVSLNDKDCDLRKLSNGSEVATFLFTLQPVLLENPRQVVRIRFAVLIFERASEHVLQ